MNDLRPPLSPQVRTLLEHERTIVPQSAAVRDRARARAALVIGAARGPVHTSAASRTRWFVAAALVCVASAAVGATTYEVRTRLAARTHEHLVSPAVRRVAHASPSVRLIQPPIDPSPPPAEPPRELAPPELRPSKAEAARVELQLLRRVRTAVAREDFAAALALIAEDTKRFRDGRMVEEREALRVKTLVGLGRMEDARRAAVGFEARFPHSVLLSTITRMPTPER